MASYIHQRILLLHSEKRQDMLKPNTKNIFNKRCMHTPSNIGNIHPALEEAKKNRKMIATMTQNIMTVSKEKTLMPILSC